MTTQKRIDQFANRIAARLEGGGVSHDVSERLRIARQQALAARKTAALAPAQPASAIVTQGRHAALAAGGEPGFGWLGWLAPALALAVLLVGLLALQPQQMRLPDPRVAEVDADLVADALPPKAYADPGFLQYLRLTQPPANVH